MGHIESLHTSSNILAHTFVGRLNERVMSAVCLGMNENGKMVAPAELMEKNRQSELVFARSTCMLILWGHYGHGCTAVSKVYDMNHASVIYARSKAVARIEQEGWCGRVYIVACHLLGIEPLDFIHPKLVDKPVEYKYTKTARRHREKGMRYVDGGTASPTKDWTAEQLERLKISRKYPGGAPRGVLLEFSQKFGVEL
jgi:hypothetical protein